MADPLMTADAPTGDEAGAGYTICMTVTPDGKVMIGTKPAEPEGAEGMKPVASMRDAMSMAMEIYQNDGAMPDGQEDEQFNEGFGKAQKAPMIDKQRVSEEDM